MFFALVDQYAELGWDMPLESNENIVVAPKRFHVRRVYLAAPRNTLQPSLEKLAANWMIAVLDGSWCHFCRNRLL